MAYIAHVHRLSIAIAVTCHDPKQRQAEAEKTWHSDTRICHGRLYAAGANSVLAM